MSSKHTNLVDHELKVAQHFGSAYIYERTISLITLTTSRLLPSWKQYCEICAGDSNKRNDARQWEAVHGEKMQHVRPMQPMTKITLVALFFSSALEISSDCPNTRKPLCQLQMDWENFVLIQKTKINPNIVPEYKRTELARQTTGRRTVMN